MIQLTPGELRLMRQTQNAAMMDTCRRLAWAIVGTDELGNPIIDYVPAEGTTPCGYDPDPGREVMQETQVAIADARLRLPIGTEVDNRDRFQIEKRNGETLDPAPVYEVIGLPMRGTTGLLLDLRIITLPDVIEAEAP